MSKKDVTPMILDMLMQLHYISDSLLDLSEKENPGSAERIEQDMDVDCENSPSQSLEEIQASLDNIEDTIRCLLLDKGFSSAAAIAQYQQYIYPKKD